ncbi:MAG TPA: amino acid adenylation domain-containing protein, partial [Longimicrobium sp.]
MTVQALLAKLQATGIQLRKSGGGLAVSGGRETLDTSLLRELREHKAALLDLIDGDGWWSPAPIRPEMLPLVELTQAEIDAVVAGVPGGARNVQDIYPLAPLQEGILFHHLLAAEGDPYLGVSLYGFDSRERLDAYVGALQAVVDRHDILRTSVAWEGLREPVQVVWRQARLEVEEVELDPAGGDAARQLWTRLSPRRHRLDVRRAPLIRLYAAREPDGERWVLLRHKHHLVGDHVTFDVVNEEIRAHLEGRADLLPAPLPFRDYVAQARLGVSRAEHEAYFRALLGDVEEPTAPFGLLDVWGDGSGIEEARLAVDASLAARLRERARALGVSAAAVCHAAWAQVLARATGRGDVVFGTVLFGRMSGGEGADRVLGPFINTLPVRVRVASQGVEAAVLGTHRQLAELLRHEHASLALAQRCSGVAAPAPLFTAVFNYRHFAQAAQARDPEARRALAGMRGLEGEERTNYPVMLSVDDRGEALGLAAQAPASVGAGRLCAMMHRALEGVVEALEAAPARALARVDVLPAAERRRVLEEWNATAAGYPAGACIHDLFEAQAARSPDAVAVVSAGGALTYAELDARANRLARHLRERGVGPEARVGLCVERGLEMMVGLLAVLKAGGAYVPLDPGYPEERLRYMLADSAPAVLLTQASLAERLAGMDVPVVALDADAAAWADRPGTPPPRAGLTPDHLAYLIYTSGSTGAPKGVAIAHGSAVNFLSWGARAFAGRGLERTLFSTSLNFDLAVFECFVPLAVGATVRLVRDALEPVHADIDATLVNTVPSAMQALVDAGRVPPGVRTVNLAGEPLKRALVERIFATTRVERVCNLYGPSETTTYSTWVEMGRRDGFAAHVGRPIANTRVYLLDGAGEPVPAGVVGELYIGGVGVARGYLGRPGLTAERFVPDPFGGEPGARLYRTGDLGRWLPGGTIEFLGRNDAQVKIRGFRVEPGEVEARLAEHPEVREAVVLAREDAPGEKRLVAYWVGGAAEAETLRAHLSASLPEHMVPAAYVRLEVLPLTPNGKVDRRALPAPEGDAYARRGYEAPVGEAERALAELWADVLGVERVGRRDHFFELGGHSLLAVQVVSRVRQVLGVEAALGEVFDRPVLADFARGLEAAARAELPEIEPADRSGRLPLSFAQRRLWFLEQFGSAGAAYHLPLRLRLKGELDRAALGRALDRIVARHEALRTTFSADGGVPEQRIAPAEESRFALVEHDLGGHADAEGELGRLLAEEAAAPFDLERGPLIRGRLVRLAADDHALLVTMHHVVSDGWSMGVLARELGALYAAFRRGDPDPLPPLPVQYADYAAWQRRWVDGEVLQRQADYWTQALAGAPELLELPTDHPRPARQDHAGASVTLQLDEELTAGLKALGRRQGTTLFMTLLAGWAAVLARLSEQDDVVVGTPTASRGRREIEGLIGFFVNTLAVRVDLSGSPTVAELLGRVKARALEAQQNQDIPFEEVVERVQPARSLAHSPVFQVMFAWQNTPAGRLELPGLEPGPVRGEAPGTAKFDLTLTLSERGGRIAGGVEYATSLFERATVERYAVYLRRVLEEMAADAGRRVERLDLLPEAERRQVVEEWNATDAEYPREACLHELFEAQARRSPEAVAVVQDGRALSYRELNARANRLGRLLRERGVGPGARVAVLMPRSVELVAAELAVLKAGAAYVPIDPSFPAGRIAFMVADSGSRVVLSLRGEAVPDLPPARRIDVDAVTEGADDDLPVLLDGGAPAYVMYTSGSTGEPKGVVVPHRAVARLVLNEGYAGFGPDDRVAFASNPTFDASTLEVWAALLNGGRVVVVAHDVVLDPGRFGETLERHGVSVLWLTVGLFNQYAAELAEPLGRLRCLIVGGDRLDPAVIGRVLRSRPPGRLLNGYGPTETTTFALTHRIEGVADDARGIPLGRPVSNTRVYVLDRRGGPVPVGVAGELYVGGAGVAHGYLNRPGLTAERFVPDPFGGPGERLYRTGDRCRWLADGTIEFLGRNDFQVKVRGFRIEPGEVEARLAEHPEVREAVVLAREDAPGEKRLVAYWVGGALEAEALRAHLAAKLPEYMVPAAYVRLEALPLTPNGKVDRRALPAPGGEAYAARAYEAPAGEAEQALAEVWADVLGVERVGRRDHFFELGGHSLLAVQVVSRVRRVLGAEVALGDLFARPVLADFARGVEAAARAELPEIEPADREGRLPLSFAQQRLWFLEQLGDAGAAYHIPARLRLKGELDRAALARALDRIVARHEALRTTFSADGGVPAQRIAPAEESRFALVEHDLGGHADAEGELGRLLAEEEAAPFDLERGPLIRGRLVRLAADDHVLLVTMHHVVSDGWSMGVLTRELGALYAAFRRGDPDPLPPLPVQYADYAAWQRRWVDGEVLRRQGDYWTETLAGAPELLELPTDHPRPARQDHAGASAALELDEALTAGLKALGRRHGTTLFMTLLAGWATVLGRLSGQRDVVVGTPTANRGRREIEGLIGFFVNTLAVRVDLSGSPTVAELLERVKARALEAQQNQDIPFEQVVERVQPARSLAHAPVFQVMFAWQNAPGDRLELPGLELAPVRGASRGTAKFDLTLTLSERGGRVVGGVEYATALFAQATVERWLGYLRRVLEEMAADADRRVERLDVLPESERRRVVEEWNATEAAYPREACAHELFEAQVERAPDAVAV